MIVNKIIIHKINKQPNQTGQIQHSNRLLPTNDTIVSEFANTLSKAYFHKKSRFYTEFKIDENEPMFKIKLDNYIANPDDYIDFSRQITSLLKNEMERKPLSKGGVLVIMDYTSTQNNNYLFIALLDNKSEFSIEEDTLDIIKQITLNIEHMAMASVINLSKYQSNQSNYLTFLKGLREIPDYFVDFIGADKNKKRDIKELTEKWVKAIEDFYTINEIDDLDNTTITLINKVKELHSNQEIITSDIIANIVYPQEPDKFLEFVYDESNNYELPNEFDSLDTSCLGKLRIISYNNKSKNFSIKFKKRDFGNMITINDDKNKIIIKDEELVREIYNQIEGNND